MENCKKRKNMEEQFRLRSVLSSLTPFQQEQIKTQVASYQATLTSQRLQSDKIQVAVYEFWKTMVTYLYNSAAGRPALTKTTQPPPGPPRGDPVPTSSLFNFSNQRRGVAGGVSHPPPPPPLKPHPLSISGFAKQPPPPAQMRDMTFGDLNEILNGITKPTGLQDWANRVYMNSERHSARTYLLQTLQSVLRGGQLHLVNWMAYPVTPVQPPPVKKSRVEVHDVSGDDFVSLSVGRGQKVAKAPKVKVTRKKGGVSAVAGEELSKRAERANKYRDHLVDQPMDVCNESAIVNVKYEFGNDEADVFEKTNEYAVVGLCETMEKRYFRLTAAPDPNLVRPEYVLKKWVVELERIWTNRLRDWQYVEDQMRAIRQDLTVQNLRGEFTMYVYELNARWALESGDLGQFNQCQTQLKQLHALDVSFSRKCEFMCYRLMYYFYQNLRIDEQIFLNEIFANTQIFNHPYMKFTLQVRTAATTNSFSRYFELSKQASAEITNSVPSHLKFLMGAFETRQRIIALVVLTKAFVTKISIEWLTEVLGFNNVSECKSFLSEHRGVMKDPTALDPKSSHSVFASSSLIVSSKLNLMG